MLEKKRHITTKQINHLAKQLANGKAEAIAQIYKLTYTSLVHFGLQIAGTHQQELVEGVVQDFFIWLAKNYQKLATISNFEAYLYHTVRTNIKQRLQAQHQKRSAAQRYHLRTEPIRVAFPPSPEQLLLEKEQMVAVQEMVNQQLDTLPATQKEAIYLRFYENRSYKEIAQILSTNAQVARNYVFRALSTLRNRLGRGQ